MSRVRGWSGVWGVGATLRGADACTARTGILDATGILRIGCGGFSPVRRRRDGRSCERWMCRRSAGVVACVYGGAGLAIGVDLVWVLQVRQRVVIYAHAAGR